MDFFLTIYLGYTLIPFYTEYIVQLWTGQNEIGLLPMLFFTLGLVFSFYISKECPIFFSE